MTFFLDGFLSKFLGLLVMTLHATEFKRLQYPRRKDRWTRLKLLSVPLKVWRVGQEGEEETSWSLWPVVQAFILWRALWKSPYDLFQRRLLWNFLLLEVIINPWIGTSLPFIFLVILSLRPILDCKMSYNYKVNRCLARYSPRATTTNQMSRQGMAQNEQKCHFRAKFGLFWAKNPNFYWRNQKFCHPHNGKPT